MKKSFRERIRNSKNLQIFLLVCGAILFYVLLNNLGAVRNSLGFILSVLAPVIVAAIISFLLYPIVRFFENRILGRLKRRKLLHGICVIFTVVILCGLAMVLLYLIIHQLAASVTHLLNNFDSYVQALVKMIDRVFADSVSDLTVFGINLRDMESTGLQNFADNILAWCAKHYEGIIGSALSV